ncbi:MAG: ABC transporter ATP-binding protein [Actinomycetota bacterium]|nr:ABC transporter ATP-binding protein [Actinomycetota bacterium]
MSTQQNAATAEADGRTAPEVIRTERLTKRFPHGGDDEKGLTAVDNLDLSVCRGEIFGLLGPNGAGKTTTVGMLTTRVIPTSGRALVDGIDVVAHAARVKRVIGVVHQLNTLDRGLSVWENLYFHGRYFGMNHRTARAAADDALERFRLAGRGRADVRTLSGGMARRLMVARAFLHRPSVLFLDEPTAGLDPQSRLALWDILSELRSQGETIFLTTHYMEEADKFCDRVAIIDHGHVLALDTPANLKKTRGVPEGTVDHAKARLAQLRAQARVGEGVVDDAQPSEPSEVEEAVFLQFLEDADQAGGNIEELPTEVTLESVFINLTGRDLRE